MVGAVGFDLSSFSLLPPGSNEQPCGQSRPMKWCKPPACATISGPGFTNRWYVLQNMSCTPAALACSFVMAFIAAFVPTGTKPGVSMTPCGVWMRPTRARDFFDS